MQHGGVELYKLHISHRTLGTIYHSHAITCCYDWVGGSLINSSATSCTHHCHLREIGIHLLCFRVEDIGTVALYIIGLASHLNAQMVLSDDLHSEVILLDIDVGIAPHCCHQTALYLGSRIISMVQNTKLRMTTLTMQVEETVLLLIKVDTPLHQFLNLRWSHSHHLLYSSWVRDIVASNHRILNMLLEVIHDDVSH